MSAGSNSTVTRWPVGQSQGISRVADALLRSLGGVEVTFLFPQSVGGGSLSELGAAGQTAVQVMFSPAVVKSLPPQNGETKVRLEVTVAVSAVNPVLDSMQVDTGKDLFEASLGLLYEGRLLRVRSVVTEYFAEAAYLFHVTVTD